MDLNGMHKVDVKNVVASATGAAAAKVAEKYHLSWSDAAAIVTVLYVGTQYGLLIYDRFILRRKSKKKPE